VRDVAEGLIKAGDASDEMLGRAYNLVDDRRVTQGQYLNTIAECLHVPPIARRLPYFALYAAGRSTELTWQALGRRNAPPPPLTTYGVTLLGGDQMFSIGKARSELGYAPQVEISRGVAQGVSWYLAMKKGSYEIEPRQEALPIQ
jgi:nucleoside-diphosphate-sugar epimerase